MKTKPKPKPRKKPATRRNLAVKSVEVVTPEVVETPKVVMAYKGLDENFKCRDFQYEVGETYTHDGKVETCESGFHACTRASDVWSYYGPTLARFALVELSGKIETDSSDSKHAAEKIRIVEEITLANFIDLGLRVDRRIVCDVEIHAAEEEFELTPFPGQLQQAIDAEMAHIEGLLSGEGGVKCPAFRGRP